MIPKVSRGERMTGLISYLVGPGHANEHTNPHVVAGNVLFTTFYEGRVLGGKDAIALGRDMTADARANLTGAGETPGKFVWHCSLSAAPEDGQLSEQQWAVIATQFVTGMGFIDRTDDQPERAWIAIHHGASKNGNDHIHVVVNLVEPDGTVTKPKWDLKRAQTVCRNIEREHGLTQIGVGGRGSRGYQRGELEAHARRIAAKAWADHCAQTGEQRGWGELPPEMRKSLEQQATPLAAQRAGLETHIRAIAAQSHTEADFIRLTRLNGIIIRPYFAKGTTDVITGYRVAYRNPGQKLIWYGGGSLSRDLTLPKLRENWPDTPQDALEASSEWRAVINNQPIQHPQHVHTPSSEQALHELQQLNARLLTTPATDDVAWSKAARDLAGAMYAYSHQTEAGRGPIARAARELARAGELRTPAVRRPTGRTPLPGITNALLRTSSHQSAAERYMNTLMLQSISDAANAVARARAAQGDLRQARLITQTCRAAMPQQRPPIRAKQPQQIQQQPNRPLTEAERLLAASNALPVSAAVTAQNENAPRTRHQTQPPSQHTGIER